MPKGSRKNTSRNNKSAKVTVTITDTIDDKMPSIVIKQSPPSSKKTTPKTRAPFQEPLSSPEPPKPWQTVGMSEEEWIASRRRVQGLLDEWQRQDQMNALADEWITPRFWEQRIEVLEMMREKYNKIPAWSSKVVMEVERIDAAIEECEAELEAMYDEQERLEYMYD